MYCVFLTRQDLVCHDYKAGWIQIVLGDPYGRPVLSTVLGSDMSDPDGFRFCHISHQHPEIPKLTVKDVNGKFYINFFVNLFSTETSPFGFHFNCFYKNIHPYFSGSTLGDETPVWISGKIDLSQYLYDLPYLHSRSTC